MWGNRALGQNLPEFESISTAQGLSQGMIFDMLQDEDGFIWVGTKNGLNRYDGYNFKIYSHDPYNKYSLSSNSIVSLLEDSKGRIWVGTEDHGVNVYDKKSGNFYRIQQLADGANQLSGNNIRHIEEMIDGRFLVSVYGGGFNVIELKADFLESKSSAKITRLHLPNNVDVYGMGKDKSGQIWLSGMDGKVYKFDPLENKFQFVANANFINNGYLTKSGAVIVNSKFYLELEGICTPLFDSSKFKPGNILLKSKTYLWRNFYVDNHSYFFAKREMTKPLQWNVEIKSGSKICFPFLIDHSGVLWTGSIGYGLRKYNHTGNKFNEHLLPGFSVRWLKSGFNNEIYVADYGYSWIKINSDKSIDKNPFKHIDKFSKIDNFLISKNSNIWVKSELENFKGYYNYDTTNKVVQRYGQFPTEPSGDKQPIVEDSNGFIWFPVRGGLIRKIHINTGRIDSFTIYEGHEKLASKSTICTALYEDKQQVFWIGTQNGMVSVQYKKGKGQPVLTWYVNAANSRNSLNYNHVSCFLDDPSEPEKYLWIGTKGGGLNRLNKITGDFLHLNTKDGLPDDVVYGMLADEAKNIWGSTNNGIFCLLANPSSDSTSWVFRNFTSAYGLQGNEFNTGAYLQLPAGKIAFGGVNGFNIFDPKQVLDSAYTPKIFITNLLVNNNIVTPGDATGLLKQNIETTQNITLNHLQDIITFEFSSLDFTAPQQNKYRYQLLGIDKSWVESGNRRSATYLHLPAGKYIFKVQGSNSQGIWSSYIKELEITILPPWWRSWWAYILYGLLIAFLIRAYIKFNLNKAKLQSQLTFEQIEAKRAKELDTIKTQLYTNITHEFRTPLTLILGMAQQVKNKPEKHLQTGIDMIVRNGESLLNLVNEILDLSKLEMGKMQFQWVHGDVIAYLKYIVESFYSLAESQRKQLHFITEIESLEIEYDAEKLRQIVSNLLSNAIKFTPEKGNIYISIHRGETGQDVDIINLLIKVKDTGIGIPEDQLPHVFDRFYRFNNGDKRKTKGTGIGLALTKELVKLMNGEIVVKSNSATATNGTEFSVTLPFNKEKKSKSTHSIKKIKSVTSPTILNLTSKREENLVKKTVSKPLILLVEDHPDVVVYISSCLSDYRLAVARDGREGLEIAVEIIPDLIVTDVMMPIMDGFEMVKQLRNHEITNHIPIIMLTAKADIQSKIEGLQMGADVYLAKPFNKEELEVRVKKMLEMRYTLQQYYLKKAGLNNVLELTKKTVVIPQVDEIKMQDAFVIKITQLVEKNIDNTEFTVDHLCKLMFISHSQLHRKLEALTGFSPNRFIRLVRLKKAQYLLQNPSNSIGSVALDCGYKDPGYFARVFKQEFGVAPQEWRNGKGKH